jgi:hypothetical protein
MAQKKKKDRPRSCNVNTRGISRVRVRTRVWERRREGVYSLGYDPRPTPSLLLVGMKLSDPDLLKTAEPLIIISLINYTLFD